jgi:hypothetical protein
MNSRDMHNTVFGKQTELPTSDGNQIRAFGMRCTLFGNRNLLLCLIGEQDAEENIWT